MDAKGMEGSDTELEDDSSFEILPSSDEDDTCMSSVYESALQDSSFEKVSNASDSLDDEPEDSNHEEQVKVYKENGIAINFDHIAPYITLLKEISPNLDSGELSAVNLSRLQNSISCVSTEELNKSPEGDTDNRCIVSNSSFCDDVETGISTSLEMSQMLDFVRVDDTTEMQTSVGSSAVSSDSSAVENSLTTKPDPSIEIHRSFQVRNQSFVPEFESSDNRYELPGRSENVENSQGSERCDTDNCQRRACSVMKQALTLFRRIQHNLPLGKFLRGAKTTFNSFLNTFEMEINEILGLGNGLKIVVIADEVDCMAIEAAFCNTFDYPTLVERCSARDNSMIPVLPIGYSSALNAAHIRIFNAKQDYYPIRDKILVSTAGFIVENTPQRWQMSTVLCLEDPVIELYLHNFSVTIPVPNEYIHEAQGLTPEDYPLKDHGFAVTLKDVMDSVRTVESGDIQELLTGVSRYDALKSAAEVLAGMYKKYTNRFT